MKKLGSITKKAALSLTTIALMVGLAPTAALASDDGSDGAARPEVATSLTTQEGVGGLTTMAEGTLDTSGMSIRAGSSQRGEAVIFWELAPLPYHPEFTNKKVTIRYYYAGNTASAKTKTVKFDDARAGIVTINKLTPGKTIKMQLRLSGTKNGKTYRSERSALKSVKVAQAPTPGQLTLTTPAKGTVKATWKAPSSSSMKGLTSPTYTVRWAYNSSMKNAKTKTVKKTATALSNLKGGKTVYVQVRVNAKYNDKVVHSPWSPRDIKVKA